MESLLQNSQPLDFFIFIKIIIRRIQDILLDPVYLMESLMYFECSESFGMTNAIIYDSQEHIFIFVTYTIHTAIKYIYDKYMCTYHICTHVCGMVWVGIYVYGREKKWFKIHFIMKSTK